MHLKIPSIFLFQKTELWVLYKTNMLANEALFIHFAHPEFVRMNLSN